MNYVYPICLNTIMGIIDTPYMRSDGTMGCDTENTENTENIENTKNTKNNKNRNMRRSNIKTLYAIRPDIIPLPYGMEYYCLKYDDYFPYKINRFAIKRDPFSFEENCIMFVGWKIPVKNTIPLNVYKTSSGIFLSLDEYKNTINVAGTDYIIKRRYPPIYLMEKPIDKFLCENKVCVPDEMGNGENRENIVSCMLNCEIFSEKNSKANVSQKTHIYSNNLKVDKKFLKVDNNIKYILYSIILIFILYLYLLYKFY